MVYGQKKEFNAVIEGTFHDDWLALYYKIAELRIPEETGVLDDGRHRYRLYGITKDFKNILEADADGPEAKTAFLGFCPGVVLPYRGGIPHILDRPRAVVTSDGRIYIDEKIMENENYLDDVLSIAKTAGEIFGKEEFKESFITRYHSPCKRFLPVCIFPVSSSYEQYKQYVIRP